MSQSRFTRGNISLHDVPERERQDYFETIIQDLHCDMSLSYEDDDLPHADLHQIEADGFQVIQYTSSPATFRRSAQHIRKDNSFDYEFVAPVSGTYYGQHMGRDIVIGPGQFCLVDYSKPIEFGQNGTQRGVLFKMPRNVLEDRIADPSAACGVVLDGQKGISRVTLDFLKSISQESRFSRQEYVSVCHQLLDLFALSLQSGVDFHMSETTARTATLKRIKAHIRENLSDARLGTPSIAAAFGLSPRYIQILFKSANLSVCDYVRDERLKVARTLLLSPLHKQKTITEIAFKSGFSSSNYFSSSFKKRFGRSPSDLRGQSPPSWVIS